MQRSVLSKVKPFIEETIVQLYCTTFPQRLTIADLGCSTGTNSLFIISELLKAISEVCQKLGRRSPPEFQLFLNDLPENDFNTVFKSTPNFYEKFRSDNGQEFGPIFVGGVPGSFYNRLFPTETLNFVHSSFGLHWLSQIPQGIENNKGNVYMARTSPSNVYQAYAEQFNRDFSVFSSLRSKEMMIGGCMVISIIGRRCSDPPSKDYCCHLEVFSKTLRDMVSEGLIEEVKLDSFNLPYYAPSIEEVQTIIESEGSFDLDWIKTFDNDWDTSEDYVNREFVHDKIKSGKFFAKTMRAVIEPIFVSHFGDSAIEDLFCRYAKDVGEILAKERPMITILVFGMTKN
ncbi:Salicylate carboxymethyltransferase [Thalictrum thalictroides]|uniref:Salicylate carboxymethyltransferase n=1 Tax=Thalictrum thalictroides TaxID=46969 RepID=A0A7J6XFM2_THATH|nr:Salicylate carboxymethyltransferase [Thalictrum thalictroides]